MYCDNGVFHMLRLGFSEINFTQYDDVNNKMLRTLSRAVLSSPNKFASDSWIVSNDT